MATGTCLARGTRRYGLMSSYDQPAVWELSFLIPIYMEVMDQTWLVSSTGEIKLRNPEGQHPTACTDYLQTWFSVTWSR